MFPCISKTLFGIECLGCGFQRALLLIIEGDFEAAFRKYPPIYSSLILLFFVGLHYFDSKRNNKNSLLIVTVFNTTLMIASYYYKHFYH
jgi:hypothetical protein